MSKKSSNFARSLEPHPTSPGGEEEIGEMRAPPGLPRRGGDDGEGEGDRIQNTNSNKHFMKHLTHLTLAMAAVAVLLSSCRADVDLKNIDGQSKLDFGLVMPVGSLSATVGDFYGRLGDSIGIHYKQPGQTGLEYLADYTLYFQDTFHVSKPFHKVDLASYAGTVTKTLLLGQEIPVTPGVGRVIPAGYTVSMDFDMPLTLGSLNSNYDVERLDSMLVTQAKFTSYIGAPEGINLTKEDIEEISIIYPEGFVDLNGNPLPKKVIPLSSGYNFNDPLPVALEDFAIDFCTDHTKDYWYPGNARTSFTFKLHIVLKPQNNILAQDDAFMNYGFRVDFIDYKAIWGFFNPSNTMTDEDTIDIAKEWKEWKDIKNLKLKLAMPTIDLWAQHELCAPLMVNLDYLFVADANDPSNPSFAKFGADGSKNISQPFLHYPPMDSPIGTSVHDRVYKFWYSGHSNTHEGDLDQLFENRPDLIGYKFRVNLNNDNPKQRFRVSSSTDIKLDAIINVPFEFKAGSQVGYSDTAAVDFSKVDFDSIFAGMPMFEKIDSMNAKVYVMAENYIPFEIKMDYTFLDENNQVVDLKLITEQEVPSTTLLLSAPQEYNQVGAHFIPKEPGTNAFIISVNREQFNRLKDIKKIVYNAELKGNPKQAVILTTTELKTKIGVSATVEAIFDFMKIKGDK